MLTRCNFLPAGGPDVYVCGPDAFVETIIDHLIAMGHEPAHPNRTLRAYGSDQRVKMTMRDYARRKLR